ncbi:hypothetical protein PC116_g31275 [Phytophthora cactorum]|nr:hypothetical protein PC116_g31275 [Phytophthora cactorum]
MLFPPFLFQLQRRYPSPEQKKRQRRQFQLRQKIPHPSRFEKR